MEQCDDTTPARLEGLEDSIAILRDGGCELSRRIAAVGAMAGIAGRDSERRSQVVAVLTEQLELCGENDIDLNTAIIGVLLQLKAVRAAVAIGRAYHANRVDETVHGTWRQVQVKLGLAAPPAQDANVKTTGTASPAESAQLKASADPAASAFSQKQRAANRAKRKLAKKSRNKNRRKQRK